ncbi:MAG: 5-nucleotidase [Chitinophagaceae bacterium]|nr:5-nucleotidase [Chitinophagaceae bacterium]
MSVCNGWRCGCGIVFYPSALLKDGKTRKLTILHTNDVHTRLDPFPMDGSRNQGLGGVAERAEVVKQIRSREEQVLLLDPVIFSRARLISTYIKENQK